MKVACQRERLHNALQVVTSVVGATTSKPVLQDVKLEASGDVLVLSATDLEVGVQFRLGEVEVSQPGAALVPARRFNDIVRNSVDETLLLEWQDSVLMIRGERSQFRVLGEDPEEFPVLPKTNEKEAVTLTGGLLSGMIRRTLFATASQSARYTLNGLYLELEDRKIEMTATDGHRLAHVERPLAAGVKTPAHGILPAKAAALMERSLGPDEAIRLHVGENEVVAWSDRVMIYARLLEGTFPRYREVIPVGGPSRLEAPTRDLEQCVRQAAVLTSDESRAVRFHLDENHLTLRSRTPEAGEAQIEMAVVYSGDSLVIGFNPKFIADALGAIEEESVTFELSGPDRPGVIKDGKGYLCVLMPLSLAEAMEAARPPEEEHEEEEPESDAEEGESDDDEDE
jgi:DNA polymerase-3 subunit beta